MGKYDKRKWKGMANEAVIWMSNELAEANRLKRIELSGMFLNDGIEKEELEDQA